MLENGLEKCTCNKKNCKRHGKCVECIEFHKTNKHEPYCKRKRILQGLFGNSAK